MESLFGPGPPDRQQDPFVPSDEHFDMGQRLALTSVTGVPITAPPETVAVPSAYACAPTPRQVREKRVTSAVTAVEKARRALAHMTGEEEDEEEPSATYIGRRARRRRGRTTDKNAASFSVSHDTAQAHRSDSDDQSDRCSVSSSSTGSCEAARNMPTGKRVRRRLRRARHHSDDKGVVVGGDDGTEKDRGPDGEQRALLREGSDGSTEGGEKGEDAVTCAPTAFQNATPPYWLQRLSDLLLFHNTTRSQSGSGQLPADSAILQLRADLRHAQELLREVQSGRDWGFLRTQPARYYEVYVGARERAADAATTKSAVAAAVLAEEGDSVAVVVEPDPAEASATTPPPPLLADAAEAEDAALPILAQALPLWRHVGAAERTVAELVAFLQERLAVLQKGLDAGGALDGTGGLELVGAPSSSGVDGTQRAAIAPAVQHAYATMVTNTLLSDLFVTPYSAFSDRAMRVSEAFTAQTPLIHDRFLLEEGIQPVYDCAKVRAANMLEELSPPSTVTDSTATRRSFSVHVDYIRFNPPRGGSAAELLPAPVHLSTSDYLHHSGSTGGLESGVVHDSHIITRLLMMSGAQLFGSSVQDNSVGIHNNLSDSATDLLITSLSLAAIQGALVTFTPEEYLTTVILQNYEQYRLLRLNLLPHLKCRTFYEEQLRHLRRQTSSVRAGMEQLQGQLEALCMHSSMQERGYMRVMIIAWSVILRLRHRRDQRRHLSADDDADAPFLVRDRRTARRLSSASGPPPASASVGAGEGAAFGNTAEGLPAAGDRSPTTAVRVDGSDGQGHHHHQHERRTVRDLQIFSGDDESSGSTDSASVPSLPWFYPMTAHMPGGGSSGGAEASLLLGSGGAPTAASPSSSFAQTSLASATGVAGARGGGGTAKPTSFRFFLRRGGQGEETAYVLGEDELLYEAGVEGTDLVSRGAEEAAGTMTMTDTAGTHMDALSFYQVVVFARSNAAVPPQYIGCTLPRPLTNAKVLFFNETFEIRALQEPQEILLHVVPVTGGQGRGTVVATVRVRPTLMRSYLLLPLEPPIAFMFKGKSFTRYAGAGVAGVLSASTTWTSAQGLTIEQVEQLFLRGVLDPRDPECAALLGPLRNYYAELDRSTAATPEGPARRRRSGAQPKPTTVGSGLRHENPGRSPRLLPRFGGAVSSREGNSAPAVPAALAFPAATTPTAAGMQHTASTSLVPRKRTNTVADLAALRRAHSAVLGSASRTMSRRNLMEQLRFLWASEMADESFFASERVRMLQRRWLILSRQVKADSQLEAKLYEHPIPLSDVDSRDLVKQVRREVAKEDAERSKQYGSITFDEKSYYEEPSSISGLALSPLSKSTKLMLWQERQRRMKLTRKPPRNITDAELLEQYVTVPKFRLKMVFDLKPRSQLNPRRDARPKSEAIDRELLKRRQDSRIVVHIMKAHNLPTRADGTPLEPFVQVGFVYESAYSRSEVGSAPSWFQTVEVPFQPLDFDEDTLNMIDDDITITVYDKVEIPMLSTVVKSGVISHETHYRTERRLLGTLRLPFYSLHQATRACMEGVYPLRTPRWLLGYAHSSDGSTQSQQPPEWEGHSSEPTIQLYISLWPPLQREKRRAMDKVTLTRIVRHLNVSAELHYLHEVALQWSSTANKRLKRVASLNALAGRRDLEPFVFCSTGDMVLVCRYLLPRGGPPPGSVKNVFEAIRYVSLLPFAVDIMTWGDKDVWSTNAELLTLRSGDYEELALLLAHFLRYLSPDFPTFVVVGIGEIYEQTIMVLHLFEGKQWRLIDPRTGNASHVEKPYGTVLKDVSLIISHDQIWANIQMSGLPHRMSWDLGNSSHWLPCFDSRKDRRLLECLTSMSPIQREVLSFLPASLTRAREVEVGLRAALKQALLAWRHHYVPAYHRGVEAILRELLVSAEAERCAWGSTRSHGVTVSAVRRLSEYFGEEVVGGPYVPPKVPGQRRERSCIHLVGAPVTSSHNPADKSYHQILQQVFETAVHEVGTGDVSFAAGVYVKSYTEDVNAMWVFLVAICRDVEYYEA